ELLGAGPFRFKRGSSASRRWRGGRHVIHGNISERAPLPLKRSGGGIEHDHPAITIAVGDEYLVRFRDDERVGGTLHALGVRVSAAFVVAAQLKQELSFRCELQQHVVGSLGERCRRGTAAADPDVVFVVDEDTVLAIGPVESLPWSAPGG